jgi:hypothetical protein
VVLPAFKTVFHTACMTAAASTTTITIGSMGANYPCLLVNATVSAFPTERVGWDWKKPGLA